MLSQSPQQKAHFPKSTAELLRAHAILHWQPRGTSREIVPSSRDRPDQSRYFHSMFLISKSLLKTLAGARQAKFRMRISGTNRPLLSCAAGSRRLFFALGGGWRRLFAAWGILAFGTVNSSVLQVPGAPTQTGILLPADKSVNNYSKENQHSSKGTSGM